MNLLGVQSQGGDEQQGPEVLRTILDENALLNSLNPMMMRQIITSFKIQLLPSMQRPDIISKIKEKISDIILQEKDQCIDYLTLPKFKNLSDQSKTALKEIMSSVWEEFQKKTAKATNEKKCEMFFCGSENPKQIQTFHLGLFNFFKTSFFYGCLGNMNSQQYFQHDFHPNMVNNQNPQQFPSYNSNEAMGNPFPSGAFPENQDKKSKISGNSKQRESQVKVEQYNSSAFQRFNLQNQGKIQPQKPSKKNRKAEDREPTTPRPKFQQQQLFLKYNQNFSRCKCKGNFQKDSRFFQCSQCKKQFHLSCLKIPNDAVERPDVQKTCPECLLLKNNIFYEILGEPLESLWVEEKDFGKCKIIVRGRRSTQILQNQYSIQLRFLRFSGKTIFELDDKPLPNNGVRFNEIIIKHDMISQGNPNEEIKISLEPLPTSNKNEPNKKPPLIYLAAFVVKLKSVSEILNGHYQQFEDNYLDKFFKEDNENEKLKIEIMDGQLKMIETPVRGTSCQHHSVFDLEQFIRHILNLGSDSCFFCPKKCQNFKIDKKILAELKKIKETVNDPEKYPSEIFYHKNGTFSWEQLEGGNQSEGGIDDEGGLSMGEQFNSLSFSGDDQ